MRAADALMQSLKAEGVEHVFGIPGGANLPTYDALVDAEFRHIQVRHEQGGGHAAEGYAKASGKVGVAFATSGPGATNLVTAIADAMLDSVPTVFITGQVRTELIGTDGFQEADILGATLPFVKHSFQVTDPRQIPEYVHEAFHVASTGRPGPVLLDIPQDLSRADIDYAPRTEPVELAGYKPPHGGNIKQIRIAAKAIANARKPILYTGGGVVNANASEELREFAAADRFPITSTLMGLGAYPASGEQWLGMLGMHGTRAANYAMDEADLIVAIGARFDDRITGKLAEFAPHAKFIHIDIDPAEISKNVPAHIPIVGDAKLVLPELTREYRALQTDSSRLDAWWKQIDAWQEEYPLQLRARQGRRDQAPVHDRGDAPGDPGRRDHHLRRRPAPDVGGAVLRLREAAPLDQLRRPGHDGLRPAGGGRRQGRLSRRVSRLPRRRRQPDHELPGAGDLRRRRHPGQGLPDEQRLHGHGPPVAGALLGPPLQLGRDGPQPRLGEAGRGLRRDRPALRGRRRPRGDDGDGAGDRRPGAARRARLARGELLPDDSRGRCRQGHGGLMEAGTPQLVKLEELRVPGQLSGRKHILSILVENKPGVLARVAGLFSRRGFNIDTLAVGPTDDPSVSRITLTLDGAVHPIDQVTKQLHKLVNVLKIRDMEPEETVAREMAMFKVSSAVENRAEIIQFAEIFRAKIVDVSRRTMTIEVTGSADKIEAFERMIRPHGLVEMVRTGEIAIARGC